MNDPDLDRRNDEAISRALNRLLEPPSNARPARNPFDPPLEDEEA